MSLSLNDVVEFRLKSTIAGEQALNVFHAQVSASSGTGATEQQVADAQFSRVQPGLVAIMSNQATMRQITGQKILPAPAGAPAFSGNPAVLGTVVSDLLPPMTCGMITKRSALAGRANRGRFYAPYPAEFDNLASGQPTNGYTGLLFTLAAILHTPWTTGVGGNTSTLTPVILHRATGAVILWSSSVARSYWVTQRRRNNGS